MAIIKTVELNLNKHSRVSIFGTGPKALVMIPGVDPSYLSEVADLVEKAYEIFLSDYRIYLIDRIDEVPSGYTMLQMADDTMKTIEELGLERFDLFGTSQGGMIALQIAARVSHRIDHLFLASTEGEIDDGFRKVCTNWIELSKRKAFRELHESFFNPMFS